MTGLQKAQLTVARPEQHQEDEQILGNREGHGKMGEGSLGISAPLRLKEFNPLLQGLGGFNLKTQAELK